MKTANYLKYGKRVFFSGNASPLYLIFFVTSRCNCRCAHCFYWKELNKHVKEELSPEEIKKISESMEPLAFLALTGGEPFLRKDLPEIAKIFYENNAVRDFNIPTNGFSTVQIVESAKKIAADCQEAQIGIGISVDEVGKLHDRLRGAKGAFERAIKTFSQLKEAKKDFPNISVSFILNVNSFNQERLGEILSFLESKEPDFIFSTLTRGSPKDPNTANLDILQYEKHYARLTKYNSGRLVSENAVVDALVRAKIALGAEIEAKTFKEKKFQGIYCNASDKIGVLFPNGDVAPCELLGEKIGNIREFGYDFKALWNSWKNRELRKKIRGSKCFCTHECFLSSSILFNPRHWPMLFIKAAELKLKGREKN